MKINYCGTDAQRRMRRNGWQLELALTYYETPEELHKRLSEQYGDVRVYWTGTMIRGLRRYFAFCK